MSKTDIGVLEARAAVHELLILHMLREVFMNAGPDGPERLQSLMAFIERSLAQAQRAAPQAEASTAEYAREVFEQLSLKLIQSLPHHGRH